MMIYTIFFQQLFYGILALLITYSVGKCIASFFEIKGNFFFKLFVTYIIGITTIVLLYSLIKAHGRTVNVLLLPIIGYLLYYYRSAFKINLRSNFKGILQEFLWSLLPFICVFLYQSWFYFDFANKTINILWSDYYQFGFYSDSLSLFGTESRMPEMIFLFSKYRNIPVPYHFPELWFTSFFSSVFKNASVNSYYFLTYPILLSCFIIGISSLFENCFSKKLLVIIISVFLVFLSGRLIPYIPITAHTSWGIIDNIGQKLAFIYCFILLGFILLKNKQWLIGILILTTIPLFSITFLPSVWGGILSFCFISLFIPDIRKISINLILYILTLIFLYLLFYSLFKTDINDGLGIKNILSHGIFKGTSEGFSYQNLKIVVSNFICYSIPTIFIHLSIIYYLYIAYFILLFRSVIKQYQIFILLFCILVGGAVATTLTSILYNSNQFMESCNSLIIVFVLICISQFIADIKSKPKMQSYGLVFLLTILIIINIPQKIQEKNSPPVSPTSVNFLNLIIENIKENNPVILTFTSESDCNKSLIFTTLPATNEELFQLSQLSNKKFLFPLGNPELYLKNKKIKYPDDATFYNSLTPVIVWSNMEKSNDLKGFIKHFNIKYLYFKSDVIIPEFIIKRITKRIESPSRHSTFCIIRE